MRIHNLLGIWFKRRDLAVRSIATDHASGNVSIDEIDEVMISKDLHRWITGS